MKKFLDFVVKTFVDSNLFAFTVYSYKVQSFNDQGNITSKPSLVSITYPSAPCCQFEFKVFNIKARQSDLMWTRPEKLNGLNLFYYIKVYKNRNENNSTLDLELQPNSSTSVSHESLMKTKLPGDPYFQFTVTQLRPYSYYYLLIQACNQDLADPELLYCLNATAMTLSTFNGSSNGTANPFATFFTSQDKPELQQQPLILTINSSFIVVSLTKPLYPNGIILLYEVFVKQLIYTNQTNQTWITLEKEGPTTLACAIDDWFDPNDILLAPAEPDEFPTMDKFCKIDNLISNTNYSITVTSSTIIGRSSPSPDLIVTTLEEAPSCPPKILEATSPTSDTIYLKWVFFFSLFLSLLVSNHFENK